MYVEIASNPPPHIVRDRKPWRCVFILSSCSPCDPDQRADKRRANTTGQPPEILMAGRRCPRPCPTLVLDIDKEVLINDKDGDKVANAALSLTVDVDKEDIGRQDGSLDGETGKGGSAPSSSTEPLWPSFDPGQNLAYFDQN